MTSFMTLFIGPHNSKNQNTHTTAKAHEEVETILIAHAVRIIYFQNMSRQQQLLRVMTCQLYISSPFQVWKLYSQKTERATQTLAVSAPHRSPFGMIIGDWRRGYNNIGK